MEHIVGARLFLDSEEQLDQVLEGIDMIGDPAELFLTEYDPETGKTEFVFQVEAKSRAKAMTAASWTLRQGFERAGIAKPEAQYCVRVAKDEEFSMPTLLFMTALLGVVAV